MGCRRSCRSENHADKREKERASLVFREAWMRCRVHGGYNRKKELFWGRQGEMMETHDQSS